MPARTSWPLASSHWMRRAIRPAIWTKAMSWPSAVVRRTAWRSLNSLDLSSEALKNFPGLYARPVMTPSHGMRFTWTSNALMKMAIRVRG